MNNWLKIIALLAFLFPIFLNSVQGASPECDSGLTGQNWTCDSNIENWACSQDLGRFRDVEFDVSSSTITKLQAWVGFFCLTSMATNTVVIEYDTGNDKVHICTDKVKGTILKGDYYGGGSGCSVKDVWEDVYDRCCPNEHPYLVDPPGWHVPRCYNRDEIIRMCVVENKNITEDGFGGDAEASITVEMHDYGATKHYFFTNDYFTLPDTPVYLCGAENCIVKNGAITNTFSSTALFTGPEIALNGLSCILKDAPDPNPAANCFLDPRDPGDSCVCYNGMSFSKSFSSGLGMTQGEILMTCTRMPEEQKNNCMICLLKNWPGTDVADYVANFTWSSSLGCVDTRTNPFITRIIQIGLGIGSGIAVVRIIQGAFLRQTNDPSKIQEGNEIITSTILALVVLAGAILIMQIIGVNILGIFTGDQFNNIITSN